MKLELPHAYLTTTGQLQFIQSKASDGLITEVNSVDVRSGWNHVCDVLLKEGRCRYGDQPCCSTLSVTGAQWSVTGGRHFMHIGANDADSLLCLRHLSVVCDAQELCDLYSQNAGDV